MISIFLLFLFLSFVQSQNKSKIEDLDSVAAKLLAFGDRDNTFPVDQKEATYLCERYNQLASLANNLVHPSYHKYGIKRIDQFMTANTVCQLFNDFPDEMSLFAAEVNNKTELLSESYQRIINFTTYVAQRENVDKFCSNYPIVSCFVHKWIKELGDPLTEQSQIKIKEIFKAYSDFGNQFQETSNCDWSAVPRVKHIKFHAINLNFAAASFNCFEKYKV